MESMAQDMGDAFVVLVAPRKAQLEAIARAAEEARPWYGMALLGHQSWKMDGVCDDWWILMVDDGEFWWH